MAINFDNLESQIRDCYGRVVYTHKTHEKCADIADSCNKTLKNIQILLSALSATGIMYTIWGDVQWVTITSAILAFILFITNVILRNNDYGEIAEKHRDAAIDIWNIKESYLSLITDIKSRQIDYDTAIVQRDELQGKLAIIYKGCLRTNSRGYLKAQKALQEKEELTFTDGEIDALLPSSLKRS